jgi:hypothetical protein
LRKTADYFRISLGAVSEGLLIARNVNEIKHCTRRSDALEILRRK